MTPTPPTTPVEPPKVTETPVALTAEAIKLPEGFTADQPLMDEFLGVMNNEKATPAERAQSLVDLQAKAVKAMSEKAMADWTALQTTWQDEVKADTEVGGDKLEANLGRISTLLNTHGTPELRQVMDQTGAGNNVHVVKFLSKIASALGESLPVPAVTPAGGDKSLAQKIFPNMK